MKAVGSIVDNLHYMFISKFIDQPGHAECHDITNYVVNIPLADEEEDACCLMSGHIQLLIVCRFMMFV
jgi:hypothetical protein